MFEVCAHHGAGVTHEPRQKHGVGARCVARSCLRSAIPWVRAAASGQLMARLQATHPSQADGPGLSICWLMPHGRAARTTVLAGLAMAAGHGLGAGRMGPVVLRSQAMGVVRVMHFAHAVWWAKLMRWSQAV